MFYLGDAVRQYRKKVAPEISAWEFASECGISPSELSKIETDRKRLTMENTISITLTWKDTELLDTFITTQEKYISESLQQNQLICV